MLKNEYFGVTPIDRSGTITAGGVAQTIMVAKPTRKGLWIQNTSSGDLWINSLADAVTASPSLKIPSGSLYEAPFRGAPTGAISIIGATAGQTFSAREW